MVLGAVSVRSVAAPPPLLNKQSGWAILLPISNAHVSNGSRSGVVRFPQFELIPGPPFFDSGEFDQSATVVQPFNWGTFSVQNTATSSASSALFTGVDTKGVPTVIQVAATAVAGPELAVTLTQNIMSGGS